jgi:hypothetical protein
VLVGGRGLPPLKILSATPVKIPAGGTVRVRVGPAGPKFTNNFQLELSDPPEGITLKSITPVRDAVEIEFEADAARVKVGLKGNLNVNATADRAQGAGKGQNRRAKAGSLPAIPFEVVLPQ